MAQPHWDVEWHESKEKWMITRHSDRGKKVEAHRKRKKTAVDKAEGLATQWLLNQKYTYSAEIHIYNKGGHKPSHIKKVSE